MLGDRVICVLNRTKATLDALLQQGEGYSVEAQPT